MDGMTNLGAPLLAWQLLQMTCLIGIAWLALRTVGKHRPHLSHVVCLVVLAKCLLPPIWGGSLGLFPQLADRFGITTPTRFATLPNESTRAVDPITEPQVTIGRADEFTALVRETQAASFTNPTAQTPPARSLGTQLVAVWLASILMVGLFFLVRIFRLLRTLKNSRLQTPDDLSQLLESLRNRLAIRRPVELLITSRPVGPAVIGIFRPLLVLPEAIVRDSSPEEIEPILAHELLHIRRGDLWVGLLQMLAQTAWWFYPPVRSLNRALSRQAERCCDEEVIAELGYPPSRYARCLLRVLERQQQLEPVPAFPGVRAVELTKQRMERIMSLKSAIRKRTPWWCWVVGAGLCALVLPGRMGIGDENSIPPAPSTDPVPATTINSTQILLSRKHSQPAEIRLNSGQLVYGVGVNSDAGVTGTIIDNQPHTGTPIGLPGPPSLRTSSAPVAEKVKPSNLAKLIHPKFNRTPLQDALKQLAREAECELLIDAEALKNEGITLNVAVDYSSDEPKPIQEILTQILTPLKLISRHEQVIDDNQAKSTRLRVTTRAKIDAERVIMTYPVSDLVIPVSGSIPPATDAGLNAGLQPIPNSAYRSAYPQYGSPQPMVDSTGPGVLNRPKANHEPLIKLIRKTIEPESWDENNTANSIEFFETTHSLVVRHRRDVHAAIAELLETLRQEQGSRILIECTLFVAPPQSLPKECRETLQQACADSTERKALTEKQLDDLQAMIKHIDDIDLISRPQILTLNNRGASVQITGVEELVEPKGTVKTFSLLLLPTLSADQTTLDLKLAINAASTYDAISRLRTIGVTSGSSVLLDVTENMLQPGSPQGVDEVARRLHALEKQTTDNRFYLLLKPTVVTEPTDKPSTPQ